MLDYGIAPASFKGCQTVTIILESARHGLKKPATSFPARAQFCDDEYMPVICPTCQLFGTPHGFATSLRHTTDRQSQSLACAALREPRL
jgi:hypothetical protein